MMSKTLNVQYIDIKRYFELLIALKTDKTKLSFDIAFIIDDLIAKLQPFYTKVYDKKMILNDYLKSGDISEDDARKKMSDFLMKGVDIEFEEDQILSIDTYKKINLLSTVEELKSYLKFMK